MERRFVLFLILSFGILLLYSWLSAVAAPAQAAAKAGCGEGGREGRRQDCREE